MALWHKMRLSAIISQNRILRLYTYVNVYILYAVLIQMKSELDSRVEIGDAKQECEYRLFETIDTNSRCTISSKYGWSRLQPSLSSQNRDLYIR